MAIQVRRFSVSGLFPSSVVPVQLHDPANPQGRVPMEEYLNAREQLGETIVSVSLWRYDTPGFQQEGADVALIVVRVPEGGGYR
jgi:hypothetical protein